jgi:hypothetical protein
MKKRFQILIVSTAFLGGQVLAQPVEKPVEMAAAMEAAFKLRTELAQSVATGAQSPKEIIHKLSTRKNLMGLQFPSDTDQALAAMDLGQRLLSLKRPAEAEIFFAEAERLFGVSISKTEDSAVSEKTQLFEQRAYVRANFLNKTPEADNDLVEAIKLSPNELRLQRKREDIPAQKAQRKQENLKG